MTFYVRVFRKRLATVRTTVPNKSIDLYRVAHTVRGLEDLLEELPVKNVRCLYSGSQELGMPYRERALAKDEWLATLRLRRAFL